MNSNKSNDRGSLQILNEEILVAIPRGDEELRVTYTTARTERGDVAWHSLRVFWKAAEGEWRPGKQGITIRAKELEAVATALSKTPAPVAKSAVEDNSDIPF